MKKILSLMCILAFIVTLFTGCEEKNSTESNLTNKLELLEKENKELKTKLEIAQEEIKKYEETYNLRNELDMEAYEILNHLQKNELNYLKDKITDNIVISEGKLIIKDKSENSHQFTLPKDEFVIRERAYMLNDDKTEFDSIYELRNDSEEHMKTLNYKFVLKNDDWLLDYIDIDE